MYRVQIDMRYLERYSEILSHDKSNAEHHLGNLVERILLDYFIVATIDETCISHIPNCEEEEGKIFAVHIAARCLSAPRPLSPWEVVRMELVLEDRISCALLELVGGRVDVEEISIGRHLQREQRKLPL